MATAVVARQLGEDYQARVFWIEACRLFSPYSKVSRVAYELNQIKAFDDVVVFYNVPLPGERGGNVVADYYQAKYHVDQSNQLTHKALVDPEAIGASTFSLLERLHTAVKATAGSEARFNLISAWGIHQGDELGELVSNVNGEFRLGKLFDGTTDRSAKGKVRKLWRSHLRLKNDEELKEVVGRLRIHAPYSSLMKLRVDLNRALELAGLKPVDDSHHGHPYDDLIRKLHAAGLNDFDKVKLKNECMRDGLWIGHDAGSEERIQIGIRSFWRFTEYMEDETQFMLCLLKHFQERKLNSTSDWQNDVGKKVVSFLQATTKRGEKYLLFLDAHASIALVAGTTLDSKSGVDVALVQNGAGKREVWQSQFASPVLENVINTREETGTEGGTQIAVALGVSNVIAPEVVTYVRNNVPAIGKILIIETLPKPSQMVVRDGAHAFRIAESAIQYIRAHRTGDGQIHLFSSVPNSLMFYFGRLARGLGRIQAYEYRFEAGIPAAYEPSVSLPFA